MSVFGLAVRSLARGLLGTPASSRPVVRAVTIDLNRASVGDLQALPGVGAVRAEAIVLDRVRNGTFASVDDLVRVDGVGPETLERLRPFVECRQRGVGNRIR